MLQIYRCTSLKLLKRFYSASIQLEDAYCETMSSVASQVMILTTSNSNHDELKGVTLSSVSSLSIRPKCLVQFNLMTPSLTSDLLHSNKRFALHILSPTKESGELARLFSRNRIFDEKIQEWKSFFPFKELKQDQYEVHEDELPLLTKNVERIMICEKNQMFKVQDHEIWIGEVIDIIDRNKGKKKTGGLLNFNRSFHKVETEVL